MDRLERLVNLVAALIDTPRPLTRAEIAERIDGYSADPLAFRRNFERDKDLLRQMGFPVVTVTPENGSGEDIGYRIPRELYELPDPGLDEAELAALRLAASAVQTGGDGSDDAVTGALRKLAGAVSGPSGASGGPGPGARGPDPASGRLATVPAASGAATAFAAVSERRRLRFTYRGEVRLVDPWRLSYHRGHWYLAGLDHHRGEERLYRLDRVEGELAADGEAGAFDRPAGAEAVPPPPWRMGDEEEVVARLWVDATQAVWARHELASAAVIEDRPDGSIVAELPVTNRSAFRSLVLGYLDHAEILGPDPLREEMAAWLEAMA